MSDKMLDKIAAMLAKAEATDNEAEADAYFTKAQALATTYSIDLAIARQRTAKREAREQPVVKNISIADRSVKARKHYVELIWAIAQSNDVKMNFAHNSTYVIAFGMPSDIEVVEVMYGALVTQMVESANRYLATGAYKNEMVSRPIYETDTDWYGRKRRYVAGYSSKPQDGRVARASFYTGFKTRVSQRLRTARSEARTAAMAQSVSVVDESGKVSEVSTDVVLRNKDIEVADFYKAKSTAKGSYKSASSGGYSSGAYNAGTTAGNNARLSSQGQISGGGRALKG